MPISPCLGVSCKMSVVAQPHEMCQWMNAQRAGRRGGGGVQGGFAFLVESFPSPILFPNLWLSDSDVDKI